MMDLMEHKPETVFVSYNVPPVEEERSDKPAYEPFQCWHPPGGQVEHRCVEDSDPCPRRDESNAKLSGVHEQGADIPATRLRKIASRIEPLEDEEHGGGGHHEDAGNSHRLQCRPHPQKELATSVGKAS